MHTKRGDMRKTWRRNDFEMCESGLRDLFRLPARAIFPFSQELSGGSRAREHLFFAALLVVRRLLRNVYTRMPMQCV